MASGNFYQGEKKKKKKGEGAKHIFVGPVFTPPSVLPKGKNKDF